MKKIIGIITILIVMIFGIWVVSGKQKSNTTSLNIANIEKTKAIVQLTIDDGENIATYSNIQAQTPFEALNTIAETQQIPLKTKQYDFGIFVESINGKEMTQDKSWIYYVNGKSGEVASDKYELQLNDSVEWKYTTPIF